MGEILCHAFRFLSALANHTSLFTVLPQLNVVLIGSGGTLTEGQNHILTCTASGGGSMAYTYMWLSNGSIVSGQTSSTYSFSPLRVTDSGRYSCQVSLGSRNMMSEIVTITVVGESCITQYVLIKLVIM